MNIETRTPNRYEKAGADAGPSTAMVVGIDDLLPKSMANFNHRMDVIDHRFDALENSLKTLRRINNIIILIGSVFAILLNFTSLIYAVLK